MLKIIIYLAVFFFCVAASLKFFFLFIVVEKIWEDLLNLELKATCSLLVAGKMILLLTLYQYIDF